MNKEKINEYKTEYEAKYLCPEFKENGIIYTIHSCNPSRKDMFEMIVEAYQYVDSCTPFDSDEVQPFWSDHLGTDESIFKNLTIKLKDYTVHNLSREWELCINGDSSIDEYNPYFDEDEYESIRF